MRLTTFAQNLNDLNLIKAQGLDEVILGHRDYSRFGKLNNQEFELMAQRARDLKIKVIFEWDILMTQNVFNKLIQEIHPLLEWSDSLRVQDPGAFEWSLRNTNRPIQFIAENGNHNLLALESWIEHAAGRMERIILSIELSRDLILEYSQKLKVPCEILGIGRILLFYTPRNLLSPLKEDIHQVNDEIMAIGASEESPHKGFPIIENRHGTFMFHIKEFCLIEYFEELKSMGLSFFRVDLRWHALTTLGKIKKLTEQFNSKDFDYLKENYPQDLMRGFYLVNKTDVLFPKLKNHRLQQREGEYAGEVIEAEKSSHLAIMIKNNRGLKKNDRLKILHPKGELFEVEIRSLRNLALKEVEEMPFQSIALIPFVNGVWVKSQVFYHS